MKEREKKPADYPENGKCEKERKGFAMRARVK